MFTRHWALFGALTWVVAMGLVAALVLYMNDEADDFRSRSQRGTATLVGFTESDDRDRRGRETVRRFEVYEFQAETGERVRFSTPILGSDAPRKMGDVVAIHYPVVAPGAARLLDNGLKRTTRMALWIVPLGLLFTVPFLIVWWKGRRRATQ